MPFVKGAYGLKQAPHLWFKDIDSYLQSIGFKHSSADPNLFAHTTMQVILLLYVDDILIASIITEALEAVKSLLHGYTDSDWAGDVDDRKSTGGYVFLFQNSAISWKAKKQTTVALSSTEAEYATASEATKEAIWFCRLFIELDKDSNSARPTESEFSLPPTLIYGDIQGSIKITHNSQFHERTKHIDIKHRFVHTAYEDKHIALEHTPAAEMTADILTKPPARDLHEKHCHEMGLQLMG